MCHQDESWLMFKLHQIKGYFSFSTDMSPKGRISVIFNSFELLELPLSPRVTRESCLVLKPLIWRTSQKRNMLGPGPVLPTTFGAGAGGTVYVYLTVQELLMQNKLAQNSQRSSLYCLSNAGSKRCATTLVSLSCLHFLSWVLKVPIDFCLVAVYGYQGVRGECAEQHGLFFTSKCYTQRESQGCWRCLVHQVLNLFLL